jgi:4-carboxymuconolactone decarboxylase
MPPDALDPARAALVRVSASLAARDADTVRAALATAAERADPTAVEEVILQAHLFVGFPDALNALAVWREVSGTAAPEGPGDDPAGWTARGEAVCARVYGANYGKLRENVRALHPEFEAWMVEGGYGRVIGRAGLDLATRELCIAALLAVWGAPRQLHSHLRGALNAGAPAREVDAAVEIACSLMDATAAEAVRALWADVRGRGATAARA